MKNDRWKNKIYLLLCLLSFLNASCKEETEDVEYAAGRTVNILDYGAIADGQTDNTKAIQAAIDECAKGGGTVTVPEGTFLTGPVFMRSNIHLHLEENSVLLGIDKMANYYDAFYPAVYGPMTSSSGVYTPSLIFADNVHNISVTGKGTIDGQGGSDNFPKENNAKRRPKLIFFIRCTNVKVEGITLRNSAFWVQHYLMCDGVVLKDLHVYSHSNWNNDGIDIDSKNVEISNCYIDSDDDGICFKSDTPLSCENVVVKDCIIKSNCNSIKFGTSGFGGFKNIQVSNCQLSKASEDNFRHWAANMAWSGVTSNYAAVSGIAVESVDGGTLEDVTISNIRMEDVITPIFIRLGDRNRTYSNRASILKNVVISDIVARSESKITNSITGVKASSAQDLLLRNITFDLLGGGTKSDANATVAEMESTYPEANMFKKVLPASVFYVRHVNNVTFENILFTCRKTDARPAFVFDDVKKAALISTRLESIPDDEFLKTIGSSDITVDGVAFDGNTGGGSDPVDPEEPGEIGEDGVLIVGDNEYQTQVYGKLRWMVTNSKEGNPVATTYEGKEKGENGYYYDANTKTSACPKGWRLPTWEEALTLKATIEANEGDESVKWWLDEEAGAYAGVNTGKWTLWGEQGVWRLAKRASDGREHCTLTIVKKDKSIKVEDGSTKTPRWYSVRCVQEVK